MAPKLAAADTYDLNVSIREVRMNAARPAPPRGGRIFSIADLRVIVPVEGIKEEIFADGQRIHHWKMHIGDVLVLRPNTWLCPLFHTPHRHIGLIASPDSLRICWSRCLGVQDAASPLQIEHDITISMPHNCALRHLLEGMVAIDEDDVITAEGPALITAILHLLRVTLAKPAEAVSRGDRTWSATVSYVLDHFHEPIGRETVASALALSPSYLSRLCRQRTGTTFIDYLNGVRLKSAARLLHHVDLPIVEIAHSCGFQDAGYFIRRFRRSFGDTPAAWRQAQLIGAVESRS
jgi:AraC-like DNA-binding protein